MPLTIFITTEIISKITKTPNIILAIPAAEPAILARKTLQKSWEKVVNEPAPKDKESENTDLKEAVTWAVVSGIGAGVARMAVQYALDKRKSK